MNRPDRPRTSRSTFQSSDAARSKSRVGVVVARSAFALGVVSLVVLIVTLGVTAASTLCATTSCAPSEPGAASSGESIDLGGDESNGPSEREQAGAGPDGPAAGQESGELLESVTPSETGVTALAKLDPDLLSAVQQAARGAETDGISLSINSGWRSAGYQARLHDEAIAEYGSEDEASKWVDSVESSAHVTGDAVDVGPYNAAEWLSRKGARYGLCQIYANEIWHFELRPDAAESGCPERLADASSTP